MLGDRTMTAGPLKVVVAIAVVAAVAAVASYEADGSAFTMPEGTLLYGVKEYFISSVADTWPISSRRCHLLKHVAGGGEWRLVELGDANETDYLVSTLREYGPERYWIGASKTIGDGQGPQFQWTNSRKVSWTNWGPSEPNFFKRKEECVEIGFYDEGQWNDRTCTAKNRFICEKGGFQECKARLHLPPIWTGTATLDVTEHVTTGPDTTGPDITGHKPRNKSPFAVHPHQFTFEGVTFWLDEQESRCCSCCGSNGGNMASIPNEAYFKRLRVQIARATKDLSIYSFTNEGAWVSAANDPDLLKGQSTSCGNQNERRCTVVRTCLSQKNTGSYEEKFKIEYVDCSHFAKCLCTYDHSPMPALPEDISARYRFFVDGVMYWIGNRHGTYFEAWRMCIANGGKLAEFVNSDHFTTIARLLDRIRPVKIYVFWIGLDRIDSNQFELSSGEARRYKLRTITALNFPFRRAKCVQMGYYPNNKGPYNILQPHAAYCQDNMHNRHYVHYMCMRNQSNA